MRQVAPGAGSRRLPRLNGATIQDVAVKHGLLIAREMSAARGEHCACAEVSGFPATCYFYLDAVEASFN